MKLPFTLYHTQDKKEITLFVERMQEKENYLIYIEFLKNLRFKNKQATTVDLIEAALMALAVKAIDASNNNNTAVTRYTPVTGYTPSAHQQAMTVFADNLLTEISSMLLYDFRKNIIFDQDASTYMPTMNGVFLTIQNKVIDHELLSDYFDPTKHKLKRFIHDPELDKELNQLPLYVWVTEQDVLDYFEEKTTTCPSNAVIGLSFHPDWMDNDHSFSHLHLPCNETLFRKYGVDEMVESYYEINTPYDKVMPLNKFIKQQPTINVINKI